MNNRRIRFLTLFLIGVVVHPLFSATEAALSAADFYFQRNDYRQALTLYDEFLKKQPDDLVVIERVAELKLLIDGRSSSRDFLVAAFERKNSSVNGELEKRLRLLLESTQGRFLTDEGQALFLQALAKESRKDFVGAVSLLEQSLALETGNIEILKKKASLELVLKRFEARHATLKMAHLQNPFHAKLNAQLMESYLYFRDPKSVLGILKNQESYATTSGERVFYLVALSETMTNPTDYVTSIRSLFVDSQEAQQSAALWFALGKALNEINPSSSDAKKAFNRFLQNPELSDARLSDWDPLHLIEKRDWVKSKIQSEVVVD